MGKISKREIEKRTQDLVNLFWPERETDGENPVCLVRYTAKKLLSECPGLGPTCLASVNGTFITHFQPSKFEVITVPEDMRNY